MTTDLYWHGQEDVDVFHDVERDTEYWPSEEPYGVPDEAADWYLSFEGWTEAEAATAAGEDDGDGDDMAGEDEDSDSFFSVDIRDFLEAHWKTVTSGIYKGEVDDALDAVEAVERDRDRGARASVQRAIDHRRESLGIRPGETQ